MAVNNLIAFAGKMGTGKTTAATYVAFEYGHLQLNFADPLKEAAAIMTGLPQEHFYSEELKTEQVSWLGMTPRRFLQVLGTECVRQHFGKNFWSDRMRRVIEDSSKGSKFVIGDVRFKEEADMVRQLGGKVIMIKSVVRGGTDTGHASEEMDFGYDTVITNDFMRESDLFLAVDKAVKK